MKTYIVDAFTREVFKGNPAGVCLVNMNLPSSTMLSIAQELNLSETAFINQRGNTNIYDIKYFSTQMEIPLCGHATLAASKVVFNITKFKDAHFFNCQGIDLYVVQNGHEIMMEFPTYKTLLLQPPSGLLDALGLAYIENSEYNLETNILLLEIANVEQLRTLQPDFKALLALSCKLNGVVITAHGTNSKFDFYSRYFWPWSGSNEDPVTGGTHTFLAPYWGKRLGKKKMNSFQCSKRTGGMVVELQPDNMLTITSSAKIVLEGNLKIESR